VRVRTIDVLTILAVSAAPISELRGGLPLAVTQGIHPAIAYLLAVTGNALVIPVLLFGLTAASRLARGVPALARLLDRLTVGERKRHLVARFGPAALILLTAAPFPGTGAWTACLVAHVLGVPRRRAWLCITAGVLLAGVIVLLGTLGILRALASAPSAPSPQA